MEITKDAYRLDDLAKLFGCGKSTIRRWKDQGKFPEGKRAPGGAIWSADVIRKYIEAGQASDKTIKLCAMM